MADDFYPKVVREPLYDRVAAQIEEMVRTGKLKPGDRLPPERDLASRLGVARGVVREAGRVLAERGLVSIEPGRGTFVRQVDAGPTGALLERFLRLCEGSPADLDDLDQALEAAIAERAAALATSQDVEALRRAGAALDAGPDAPDPPGAAGRDFRLALARATQNPLYPALLEILLDLLDESRGDARSLPGAAGRHQDWHHRIVAAIARGDGAAARAAMQQHLEQMSRSGREAEKAGAAGGGGGQQRASQ